MTEEQTQGQTELISELESPALLPDKKLMPMLDISFQKMIAQKKKTRIKKRHIKENEKR